MLELDWSTILWEIVNFLIITVVLYFLVFKPMTKRAEQRAIEKAEAKAELEASREESAALLAEIEDRLANLDKEIQQISDEAYANSQVLQEELLQATREEAEQIMVDALQEARKEQLVDYKENQSKLVDTVLGVTAKTLRKALPPQVHERMLDELSSYIWNLGKTDMRLVESIRESLSERSALVELAVPVPLTNEQYVKLFNTFNALVDDEIQLEVEIDDSLIAGAKARFGDVVLDNSLLAQVEGAREDVDKALELDTLVTND